MGPIMIPSNYADNAEREIHWRVFKAIWPYLLEYRSRITLALFCLVLSKAASVSSPFLLKYIVDSLTLDVSSSLLVVPAALLLAYGFARFSMILLGEIRDTIFGRVNTQDWSKSLSARARPRSRFSSRPPHRRAL